MVLYFTGTGNSRYLARRIADVHRGVHRTHLHRAGRLGQSQ